MKMGFFKGVYGKYEVIIIGWIFRIRKWNSSKYICKGRVVLDCGRLKKLRFVLIICKDSFVCIKMEVGGWD